MKFRRHGDINLHPISKSKFLKLTTNIKETYVGNQYVLAEGETTGSVHTISTETPSGVRIWDLVGSRVIEITTPAKTTHTHDHDTIITNPGYYVQVQERELDHWSKQIRQVKD